MNNLKQYAGLLNDEAPENHFLAYITSGERDMLVEAGGVKTPTPSGIFAYPPGMGDPNYGGGGGGTYGGSGGNTTNSNNNGGGANSNPNYSGGNANTGTVTGGSVSNNSSSGGNINDEFGTNGNVYSGNTVNTSISNSGNNNPQLPPGVISNNFDYETEAYTGVAEIESNFYDDETGQFTITQSPGVIPAVDYQTSNIGAYLDNPNVPDKDKTDFLGRLKAISNSDLVGTNVDGIEDQFVIDNLDGSLNSILNQTKYSEYTDNIDEVAKTFESDLKNTPLSTIAKSGGLIGTFFRGVTDNYKNNKAMDLLGYTGSTITYNPDGSGDFNYGGGFLTGNASQGERDAVNQLTPFAADAIGGTTTQPSMVNDYFNNLNNTNLGISENYLNTYNTAKTNMANTLNITPNTQQYGYGNSYNDTYSRSMNNTNIFYNYLNEQGLI